MEEPDKCINCGWDPAWNNDGDTVPIEDSWLIIPIPNSAIWLYFCPKCGGCMSNKNAIENVKKLEELKKRRIMPAKSPLFSPNGMPFGRQN